MLSAKTKAARPKKAETVAVKRMSLTEKSGKGVGWVVAVAEKLEGSKSSLLGVIYRSEEEMVR